MVKRTLLLAAASAATLCNAFQVHMPLGQSFAHQTLPRASTTAVRVSRRGGECSVTACRQCVDSMEGFGRGGAGEERRGLNHGCSPNRCCSAAGLQCIARCADMDMKYRVVVVGGGPSGSCAAEEFAKDKNIETVLLERKLDNAKPCGGAIPLCMVSEFDLPAEIIDRKVSGGSSWRPVGRQIRV